MSDNGYEEYKSDLSRSLRDKENIRRGKILLIAGTCFLVYLLVILPFHAGNVSEVRGDEVKAGRAYYPIRVYYIDNLQILRTKTDTDGSLYCIAGFLDCDGKEWILCFTPGNDKKLVDHIQLTSSFDKESDLTIKGYFQIRYMEDLPFGADSFYSIYASKYDDAEAPNMLNLNADYLCDQFENYTLAALCRPGIPLVSLVVGLFGVLYGGFLLIRNQKRNMS